MILKSTLVGALFIWFSFGSSSISEVRRGFFKVCEKDKKIADWIVDLQKIEDSNYLILAYKSAAFTMYAEKASGVSNKLKYFNKGRKALDKIISKYPSDIEPRFLRLTIQMNAPFFLGYSGEIKEDKQVVIRGLLSAEKNKKEPFLVTKIVDYLKSTSLCTAEETEFLNKL